MDRITSSLRRHFRIVWLGPLGGACRQRAGERVRLKLMLYFYTNLGATLVAETSTIDQIHASRGSVAFRPKPRQPGPEPEFVS